MATAHNLLEIVDLHVNVAGKELLCGIDLAIPHGEVHALLGRNGSGKTSLLMAVMGFTGYEVTSGRILFEGRDITREDVVTRARLGVGVAQQRPPTIRGVTLRSVIDYAYGDGAGAAAAFAEMTEVARMESFLDREINQGLSGGEIRRSELLQLLAMRPILSLLDEPDSGVDVESLATVGDLINRLFSRDACHPARRNAGLIITHTGGVLDYVQVDKAHVMLEGRIACSGNPRLILDTVRKFGYEECARCIQREV